MLNGACAFNNSFMLFVTVIYKDMQLKEVLGVLCIFQSVLSEIKLVALPTVRQGNCPFASSFSTTPAMAQLLTSPTVAELRLPLFCLADKENNNQKINHQPQTNQKKPQRQTHKQTHSLFPFSALQLLITTYCLVIVKQNGVWHHST